MGTGRTARSGAPAPPEAQTEAKTLTLFALSEALEPLAADRAVVNKDVLAPIVGRYEAVALASLNHFTVPVGMFYLPSTLRERAAEGKSQNRYSL